MGKMRILPSVRSWAWILAVALAGVTAPTAAPDPAPAPETPRKSAKPEPPNEEYLRKVIKWNPWFLAAASGDAKTIQDYLTSGTQVNARDTFGRTALYIATAYEHADIVRLLLKAGANPNLPSEVLSHWSGSRAKQSAIHTALETASQSENKDLEALLAQAGAKMQAHASAPRLADGLTPILAAIEEGSTPTLRSLLKEGSFLRERESVRGMTVPLFALWRGREDLYTVLLEQGLGPSGTQEEKNTLLDAAVAHFRSGDARRLLDAGASVGSFPTYRLADIIRKRDKKFLRMLLEAGAKPSDSLVFSAVWAGDLEIVKILETHGANVKVVHNGNTPLSIAVGNGNKAMVEYFLSKGADPNVHREGDLTPLEHALSGRRQDIADLLVQKGAKPVSEERRKTLWDPPRDHTVTTETLIFGDTPSTATHTSTIELNQYTLYVVTRKDNSPSGSRTSEDHILVFAGSPDRIPVGSVTAGENYFEGSVKRDWVEPGKIAVVQWCELLDGSGAWREKKTTILLVRGNRVKPTLAWSLATSGRSGASAYGRGDPTWSWDSKRRTLSIQYAWKYFSSEVLVETMRLAVPDQVDTDKDTGWLSSTETIWRYRLVGDKFDYIDGQRVQKIAGGFPVLDVAERYGLTVRQLVELNPELKGKVFCAGPVVVSTSIPPIDKDR